MGAGKSTVGRILAEEMGFSYCDSDKLLEEQAGETISKIFSERGEDYFRDLESQTLEYISSKEKQVVATGGGVVQRKENWTAMKKSGITVYLKASVETMLERIKHDNSRPLLQVKNPIETARELLDIRTPMYEKADLMINTENCSPGKVADEILNKLVSK